MRTYPLFAVSFCLMAGLPLSAQMHPRFKTHSSSSHSCVTSLDACPDQGCGGGDRLLNKKKNNQAAPTAEYQAMTFDDFRHLEEERPTSWKENQNRKAAEDLGEGTPVLLAGFLYGAHEGSAESCNCYLTGEGNNDYHINLIENPDDVMTDSIVVEMTPKMRASISAWRLAKINSLKGKLVRVSGYLLFDSEHVSRSGGERMTIWEVHPVMKFEVCPDTSCTVESDTGWQDIASTT